MCLFTVLHATTLPRRSQAPASAAHGAAMTDDDDDDDDDDDAVIAASTGQVRANDTVLHATALLHRSQAPALAADAVAMTDDNEDDDDAVIAANVQEVQARGAEDAGESAAREVQGLGHNAPMVSEGITGGEVQLGTAEDAGAGTSGACSRQVRANKPAQWGSMSASQRRNWLKNEKRKNGQTKNNPGGGK